MAKNDAGWSKESLQVTLLVVGSILFIVGAVIAYRDATLDYRMGLWGVLGALLAGLGSMFVYIRKVL